MNNFENPDIKKENPNNSNNGVIESFLKHQMENPEKLKTIKDFENTLDFTNNYFKNKIETEKTKTATRLALLQEGIIYDISNVPNTIFPMKKELSEII